MRDDVPHIRVPIMLNGKVVDSLGYIVDPEDE
jgi:hypothetical protein